jgi:hypothetical protein
VTSSSIRGKRYDALLGGVLLDGVLSAGVLLAGELLGGVADVDIMLLTLAALQAFQGTQVGQPTLTVGQ